MLGEDMDSIDDENIDKLFEILKSQDKRLRRIETALLGDEEMGSKGFVERYVQTELELEETQNELEEVKEKVDKIWIWASATAGLATIIINAILAIFF